MEKPIIPEKTEIFTAELGFTPEVLGRHSKRTRKFGIDFLVLGISLLTFASACKRESSRGETESV